MTSNVLSFRRHFQIWLYTISLGRLLLRSTKTDQLPTRIDIFFSSVSAIHLPTFMESIEIVKREPESVQTCCRHSPAILEGRRVFDVRGSSFVGCIVAGSVSWHEDDGKYSDPSYFDVR